MWNFCTSCHSLKLPGSLRSLGRALLVSDWHIKAELYVKCTGQALSSCYVSHQSSLASWGLWVEQSLLWRPSGCTTQHTAGLGSLGVAGLGIRRTQVMTKMSHAFWGHWAWPYHFTSKVPQLQARSSLLRRPAAHMWMLPASWGSLSRAQPWPEWGTSGPVLFGDVRWAPTKF